MKFVTFEVKTPVGYLQRVGVLRDSKVIDLNAAYGAYLREVRGIWRWKEVAQAMVPTDMLKFIENGPLSLESIRFALDYINQKEEATDPCIEKLIYKMSEVNLMAPLPRPVSIRDCSAFLDHLKHGYGSDDLPQIFYEIPAYFRTSATNVIGSGDPVLWPSYSERLDYELEFAICIGKYGMNIPVEKAEEYIFGYTIYNDISARDMLRKEMELRLGPAKGKCFQNSNVMGPCFVTPDELDASNLRMTAKINGELWSEGNSGKMHFTFPQLISYLSKDDPLYPGEIIASGTVGWGCGAELKKWIMPGDVIELEVEGIGILRNKVERRG